MEIHCIQPLHHKGITEFDITISGDNLPNTDGVIINQIIQNNHAELPSIVQIEKKIAVRENDFNKTECPINCEDIYDPVCGSDGSCFRTFNNPCEVRKTNCDKSWYNRFNITYNTPCDPNDKPSCDLCPEKCIKESNLICAFNKFCYQTFGSVCQMLKRDCNTGGKELFEIFNHGECSNVTQPICQPFCPKKCNQELVPVCAKKDKCYQSFYNECYLERTNCLLPIGNIEFHFIHTGNCLPDEMLISEGC